MTSPRALLAAVVLLGLAACTSPGTDTGKYEQTWPKSYAATTCGEWAGEMSDRQRWAAAADMLTGARKRDGAGDDALPDDGQVDDFVAAVSRVCGAAPSTSVAEAGAGVYVTEGSRFNP